MADGLRRIVIAKTDFTSDRIDPVERSGAIWKIVDLGPGYPVHLHNQMTVGRVCVWPLKQRSVGERIDLKRSAGANSNRFWRRNSQRVIRGRGVEQYPFKPHLCRGVRYGPDPEPDPKVSICNGISGCLGRYSPSYRRLRGPGIGNVELYD